jgi:Tfp pilus assembly protein PilO
VPLTLTATGGYAAVEAFLAAVQQQDRLVLLTSVALAPSTSADGQTLLTLTAAGSAFALPATDAEVAAAATAAAAVPTTAAAAPTALPTTVLTAATPAVTR